METSPVVASGATASVPDPVDDRVVDEDEDNDDEETRQAKQAAEKSARARRWRAELEREVEGSGGVVVNSCGHLMHPECRHKYSLSVARDSALGRLTVDPMLTRSALAQALTSPPSPLASVSISPLDL
jgi:hypothetical protein